MASSAYAYRQQTYSSEAQSQQPRFTLIEGGAQKTDACILTFEAPSTHAAPHVPTAQEIKTSRPHPKHFGAVTFAVAVIIAVAICVVSVIASELASNKLADNLVSVPATEYTVKSGDSLWSIAESHPIEGYTASDVVTWIIERNNLNGGLIVSGQTLSVPYKML